VATVRSVINPRGQTVSALEKLHLMTNRPILIVWGDRDPMIPIRHGQRAHELTPGSEFVVFPGAGHEPHQHDPDRFTDLVVLHVRSVAS
jgi:pimeloyl-ACP methyl ester carboxylesterase